MIDKGLYYSRLAYLRATAIGEQKYRGRWIWLDLVTSILGHTFSSALFAGTRSRESELEHVDTACIVTPTIDTYRMLLT